MLGLLQCFASEAIRAATGAQVPSKLVWKQSLRTCMLAHCQGLEDALN